MGQKRYLFIAVDYFTKWIEVETIAAIIVAELRKFIWKNIITCCGVPHVIIFNSWQFGTTKVTDYLVRHGSHPQMNGQAEAANKVILHSLQKHSMTLMVNGPTNCMASYGHIAPLKRRPLGKQVLC